MTQVVAELIDKEITVLDINDLPGGAIPALGSTVKIGTNPGYDVTVKFVGTNLECRKAREHYEQKGEWPRPNTVSFRMKAIVSISSNPRDNREIMN